MNHPVVCGPLAPGRVTAWLDFPLSGAILCNVTDTSLKKHCHSLLSGSIFSYWHFPVCEEPGIYQENKTHVREYSALLLPASRKGKGGVETQSSHSLQGVDCYSILIGSVKEHQTATFINYSQTKYSVTPVVLSVCVSKPLWAVGVVLF